MESEMSIDDLKKTLWPFGMSVEEYDKLIREANGNQDYPYDQNLNFRIARLRAVYIKDWPKEFENLRWKAERIKEWEREEAKFKLSQYVIVNSDTQLKFYTHSEDPEILRFRFDSGDDEYDSEFTVSKDKATQIGKMFLRAAGTND
jgi:hypothetical protein